MKKRFLAVLLGLSVVAAAFTGCGSDDSTNGSDSSNSSSKSDDKTIVVGASPTPHAEILNAISDQLKDAGYTLKVVEYNDYIQPNTALEAGDLDANFFQHQPYLDNFNEENGTNLVSVASVHFEPIAIYGGKTSSLADLSDGATVALPNDTTNEARALLLLEAEGLITLKADAGVNATVIDIEDNPKNLKFSELEAAQVARSLQDVDIAVINGNYALEAGLTSSDALATESSDSLAAQTYANIIAVKAGNENTDKTKALVDAILSDEVKEYINSTYAGAVVPVF